jgi:general stress protein 26
MIGFSRRWSMSDVRERIISVAKDLQLSNFATVTEDGRPWVRYVMAKGDSDLTFRFCAHLDSRKIGQIRKNPAVHLTMGVTSIETARNWLQVQGRAEVSTDLDERSAFWFDDLKHYFSGPDDPNYSIIIIRPSRIELGTMGSMTPEVLDL